MKLRLFSTPFLAFRIHRDWMRVLLVSESMVLFVLFLGEKMWVTGEFQDLSKCSHCTAVNHPGMAGYGASRTRAMC